MEQGLRRLLPETEQYDASDEKQIKRAEAAAKLRIEERRNILGGVLSTRQGRELAWSLMKDTGIFDDLNITASDYANGVATGRRQVGESLMRVLAKADPKQFAQMLIENDG